MKKEMMNMMLAMVAMFALAFVAGCDGGGSSDDDTSTNTDGDDDDTVSATDTDSDTASGDSDTDGDTDSDTDTNTESDDPKACDCLNTEDPANGCYNIEGKWYLEGYAHVDTFLLTITLTIAGDKCKVELVGKEVPFTTPFTGKTLPMEQYNSLDDEHYLIDRSDHGIGEPTFYMKDWGSLGNSDVNLKR